MLSGEIWIRCEGLESPFGLELLATVDYVVQHSAITHSEQLQEEVHKWTSRKKSLMKPYHIEVARERLEKVCLA